VSYSADDHVRLVEVTIQPGETEKRHVDPHPVVKAFDAPQPRTSTDAGGAVPRVLERNMQVAGSSKQILSTVQLSQQTENGWKMQRPGVAELLDLQLSKLR